MRWASEAILLLTHAFAGVPLLSSLLHSFALPFVLLLALTFSDLVLHASTSLICVRASRSLLRQVYVGGGFWEPRRNQKSEKTIGFIRFSAIFRNLC